jgi:hypothetical protein
MQASTALDWGDEFLKFSALSCGLLENHEDAVVNAEPLGLV